MPRGRKRSEEQLDAPSRHASSKRHRASQHHLSGRRVTAFNEKLCLEWFREYTTADEPDTIEWHTASSDLTPAQMARCRPGARRPPISCGPAVRSPGQRPLGHGHGQLTSRRVNHPGRLTARMTVT
ncbi:uncharacterized protein LOC122382592 [Amphibalanus amphitrite]|uniref:uncharacterized protein LOC122382592 n=1 Tax=Amphibalanus amphitrite TaxID=1232801 RepID=UPI001C929A10|nr:uncharacterized protein LOC122382592 [Amphibalanus amphitrite]XP_043224075.1 uncharacterized protein LOC122382592 [Amphibalanus amphitrite]XP_043224086.1 uncharacterized protein LOC122382592 [Amphibalanus amphitrite]XP_043224095.1 uncharacterized protein LOC122382592 [Amphibalanus amphitrite]